MEADHTLSYRLMEAWLHNGEAERNMQAARAMKDEAYENADFLTEVLEMAQSNSADHPLAWQKLRRASSQAWDVCDQARKEYERLQAHHDETWEAYKEAEKTFNDWKKLEETYEKEETEES